MIFGQDQGDVGDHIDDYIYDDGEDYCDHEEDHDDDGEDYGDTGDLNLMIFLVGSNEDSFPRALGDEDYQMLVLIKSVLI